MPNDHNDPYIGVAGRLACLFSVASEQCSEGVCLEKPPVLPGCLVLSIELMGDQNWMGQEDVSITLKVPELSGSND